MRASLRARLLRVAAGRCEYCRLPRDAVLVEFETEHIIARKHNGPTEFANLAIACPACNRFKGPNLSGIDPSTGQITALFHPRRDKWSEHFRWNGPVLIGATPQGRATITVLRINDPLRVAERNALMEEGIWSDKQDAPDSN